MKKRKWGARWVVVLEMSESRLKGETTACFHTTKWLGIEKQKLN
jgi:hypothetical protein